MEQKQQPERNRPADKGRNHDPHVRDEDARQPGKSTTSSSDTDSANQDLTETAAGSFREDSGAMDGRDPNLDEIDRVRDEGAE